MSKPSKFLSLPLALAVLTAGAATTYSPISCGCIDAWITLAHAIGRPEIKNSFELTPRVVADGFAKQLSGKRVTASVMPFSTSTYDCAEATSPQRTVRCRLWIWEKPDSRGADYRGFDVIVYTTPDGLFRSVQVIPIKHPPDVGV